MNNAELAMLRDRAERAFQGSSIAAAWGSLRRAIVGMPSGTIPDSSQQALAELALTKLRDFGLEPPTPEEVEALEAAICLMRPSVYTRAGRLETLPPDFNALFPDWGGFSAKARPLMNSVGRLDLLARDGGVRHVGTGFLVTDRLVATSTHVLDELTCKTRQIARGEVILRFKLEKSTVADDPVAVARVAAIHPTLDLTLLETEPSAALTARRPLIIDPVPPRPGDRVVAVGFPGDPREERESLFARAVFGERDIGLKRGAPGEVISVQPRGVPQRVHHDCSTLKGSSGGPLLSLATARVVGVHRHGAFMTRNEAVAASHLEALLSDLGRPNRPK